MSAHAVCCLYVSVYRAIWMEIVVKKCICGSAVENWQFSCCKPIFLPLIYSTLSQLDATPVYVHIYDISQWKRLSQERFVNEFSKIDIMVVEKILFSIGISLFSIILQHVRMNFPLRNSLPQNVNSSFSMLFQIYMTPSPPYYVLRNGNIVSKM